MMAPYSRREADDLRAHVWSSPGFERFVLPGMVSLVIFSATQAMETMRETPPTQTILTCFTP